MIGMTHTGFLGTLTLEAEVALRQALNIDDVIPAAERIASYDAPVGYFGNTHVIVVADGYTLTYDYDQNAMSVSVASAATAYVQILESNSLPAAGLTLAVTADIACTDGRVCEAAKLTVTATINAVADPGQAPQEWVYDETETFQFVAPVGYGVSGGNRATLDVVGLEGSADFAALVAQPGALVIGETGLLSYNPVAAGDNRLTAGIYTLTAAMSHARLLAPVLLEVEIVVAPANLDAATYGLPGSELNPAAKIEVVADYDGVAHQVNVAAGVSAILRLPDDVPDGVTLALADDNRRANVSLDPTTLADGELSATITLHVVRQTGAGENDANYNPLPQVLDLTISALARPPIAAVGKLAGFTDGVFTLTLADYQDGVYAGAEFSEVGVSPSLNVDQNSGEVTADGELAAGEYAITVDAENIPDILGVARITISLTVRTLIEPDNAVQAANRDREFDAAAGYSGRG